MGALLNANMPSPRMSPLAQRRATAALAGLVRAAGGPDLKDVALAKQSHNALVYLAEMGGRAVFVKHYLTDYGPTLARISAEESAIVHAHMGAGPDGIAEVLWSCEDPPMVVMSAAPGGPLTEVLAQKDAVAALNHVGRWLRAYVGDRTRHDQFSTSYWLRQREAADLAQMSKADQSFASELLEIQRRRAKAMGTVPAWKGRLPKDFAPHNLHWTGEGIFGFDIEGYTTQSIARSIVWFCVLAEKRLGPTQGRRFGLQRRAIDPLLAGFGDCNDEEPLLAYLAGDLLLARLIARHDDAATAKGLRTAIRSHLDEG